MAQPGSGDGFQSFVNILPPLGIPGQFASVNPRASVVGGRGAYLAPLEGTTIGVGGYADPLNGIISNYYRSKSALCMVGHAGQATITKFLGVSSLLIVPGSMVVGFDQGEFWAILAAGGTQGQKIYFDPLTGALTANATGQGVLVTITAGGASITSSVLTTTDADVTGTLAVGQVVIDSGGNTPPGTYIASAAGTGTGTHIWNLANADGVTIPNVAAGSLTWISAGVQESQFTLVNPIQADITQTCSLAAPVAPSEFSVLTVTNSAVLQQYMFVYSTAGGVPISSNLQILSIIDSTHVLVTGSNLTFSGQSTTFTQGQIGKISSWVGKFST